LACMSELL